MSWEAPPNLPELGEDEVHVWRALLDIRPRALARAFGTLSPEERRRADRFRFPIFRDRWVGARGFLRAVLGSYLQTRPADVRLVKGSLGKPVLDTRDHDSALEFNLTHSGEKVLLAVSRGRAVGVDLERMRRGVPLDRLASRFFTASEARALRDVPATVRPAAFFSCWTRKEAFLKATGHNLERGLPFALRTFSVSVGVPAGGSGPVPVTLAVPGSHRVAEGWWLIDLEVGAGYAGALAVEGRVRPRFFEWSG